MSDKRTTVAGSSDAEADTSATTDRGVALIAPTTPTRGASRRLRQRVPVGRVSTPDALVRSLRRQILEGTIPAGSHLGEVELADAYGVSRQSIRAALAELVHMGLLKRAPHRGVWVPRLTRSQLHDLWYVRSLIEVEAVRLGMRERADWRALEPAVERIAALTPESSWADAVEADLDFHRTLVVSAGSPHLARLHELLMGELSLSLSGNVGNEAPGYMSGEHQMLLDAFRSGNLHGATEKLQRHLAAGLDLVGRSPSIVESEFEVEEAG